MNPFQQYVRQLTRRHFFAQGSHAVGWAALASLLGHDGMVADGICYYSGFWSMTGQVGPSQRIEEKKLGRRLEDG